MENHCRITREHVHTQRSYYDDVNVVLTTPHGEFRMKPFFAKFDNYTVPKILPLRDRTSKMGHCKRNCKSLKMR